MNTRIVVSTVAATAEAVNEGALKPVGELSFEAPTLTPKKAAIILVITTELARLGGPLVNQLIDRD